MRLKSYLDFVENVLYSRHDLAVEELSIRETIPDQEATIRCRVKFWDDSLLEFAEKLTVRGMVLAKRGYAYHYQDSAGRLVFRYDNLPHHPEVTTHPHHKHIASSDPSGEDIVAAHPPGLSDVLDEIADFLYRDEEHQS